MRNIYKIFLKYGIDSKEDIIILEDSHWKELGVKPLHKLKIIKNTPVQSLSIPVVTTCTTTVPQNRQNRHQPSTARIAPGKRFLKLVPDAPVDQNSVIVCLEKYANTKNLDMETIIDFKAKIEDFSENNPPKKAFAIALCWLYTTETWVYPAINSLLRDDSPNIQILAPYMNALMNVYKELGDEENNYYSGIVYIRMKLIPTLLAFYQNDVNFVWSGFTSTSIEFDSKKKIWRCVICYFCS